MHVSMEEPMPPALCLSTPVPRQKVWWYAAEFHSEIYNHNSCVHLQHTCADTLPKLVNGFHSDTYTPMSRFLHVCMCVWVMEVVCSGGGTRLVTRDLHTYYTLYCAWVWLQAHANRELKQTQGLRSSWSRLNRAAAAEIDTIGEQVWPHETSACHRHYHIRLLECQSRRLCQTYVDMVKEARPLKHIPSYVCNEMRTVM